MNYTASASGIQITDTMGILPAAGILTGVTIVNDTETTGSSVVVEVRAFTGNISLVSGTVSNDASSIAADVPSRLSGTFTEAVVTAGTPIQLLISATVATPGQYSIIATFDYHAHREK